MLGAGWTEVVALAAAYLIATVTTPAGISGAVLLLPFQVSVLGTPSPAVTPTNLLYNIIATPGALYRYWRQGQTGGRLARSRLIKPSQAGIAAILALAAAVVFLLVTQFTTRQELRQSQSASQAIAAVLAAPDARIETMPATVGGSVTAVLSVRQHEAVVTTAGLPAPAGSRIYQLWVMSPTGARSAGLLPASHAGSTSPVLAAAVEPGDRLGITVEPAGGTVQPTTTPVVVMPVPVVE